MSINVCTREEKDEIAELIGGFRFTAGFGQTLSRLVRHGIGVHHAGMLPKYRRLGRAARPGRPAQGHLRHRHARRRHQRADPHRDVHGPEQVRRDAGAAPEGAGVPPDRGPGRSRAGFDTAGTVVVQAPEHAIENEQALAKVGDDPKKRSSVARKTPPEGFVSWDEKTFNRLVAATPETLTSSFRVSAAMLLNVAARPGDFFAHMRRLLMENDEPRQRQRAQVRKAIATYRTLLAGEVLERLETPDDQGRTVRLTVDLQPELRPQPAAVDLCARDAGAARPRGPDVRARRPLGRRGDPRRPAPGAVRPAQEGPRRRGRSR